MGRADFVKFRLWKWSSLFSCGPVLLAASVGYGQSPFPEQTGFINIEAKEEPLPQPFVMARFEIADTANPPLIARPFPIVSQDQPSLALPSENVIDPDHYQELVQRLAAMNPSRFQVAANGDPEAPFSVDDAAFSPVREAEAFRYSPPLPGLIFQNQVQSVIPSDASWNDFSEQKYILHEDDSPPGLIRDPFERPVELTGEDYYPVRDRMRLGLPYWDRFEYNRLPFQDRFRPGGIVNDSAGPNHYGYDLLGIPYNQNWTKGDIPLVPGGDVYLETTVVSDTQLQSRRRPVNVVGDDEDTQFRQRFFLTTDLFLDDNSFIPSPWFFRFTQGIDVRNQTDQGQTEDYAIQEWFLDLQLAVVSEFYDTVDLRLGRQLFVSDFRGFLYSDFNDMGRLFGTWDENRWQWNVVAMDAGLQDPVSNLLRTTERRQQLMLAADLFRRDFPTPGFNVYSGLFYNRDYFKQDVDAFYLELAAEGVVGTFEISAAFIQAFGHDSNNPIAQRSVDINAQFAALEVTRPTDWYTPRVSVLYASGDSDPTDGTGRGFDAIFDNPNFAGANFAFLNREALNSRGLRLSNTNSFLPNLRTKAFDPVNFVNPGILVLTAGVDAVLTTRTVAFLNYNWYQFNEPASLEQGVRLKNGGLNLSVGQHVGEDYTIGIVHKPFIIDNLILTFGGTVFQPGSALNTLTTGTDQLYTTFGAATIVY